MDNQVQQIQRILPKELKDIVLLLEEKVNILLCMEEETQGLLKDPAETWESHMDERQKCINQVDQLDQEIEKLLSGQENKSAIYAAIRNQGDVADVPQELELFLDMGQKIFAVLNRIRRADPQIQENIVSEQEELLEKIRKGSQSNEAKVVKYFNSFPEQSQSTFALGKA